VSETCAFPVKSPVPYAAGFGHRLRILRAHLDLSQFEMAMRLGIAQDSVSRIELGKATLVSISALGAIEFLCRQAGLPAGWILRDGGQDVVMPKEPTP